MKYLNQIICDNSKNIIPELQDKSIDLVITSPPYNIDLGNNKYNKNPYDIYKDNISHNDFIKNLKEIFSKLYPKMKIGGRIAINISNGKNGKIPTVSDTIQMMTKDLEYLPFSIIVWDKQQTSNRAAWGSFLSPSSPSFPSPFEFILIFSKESLKLQEKGETDLTKEEFVEWAYGIWKFKPETKMKRFNHPAMFPEELPKRLIKMLSWTNTTVLDPFNGAGTTTKVAKDLNRQYIGIDISEKYCKTARDRLL